MQVLKCVSMLDQMRLQRLESSHQGGKDGTGSGSGGNSGGGGSGGGNSDGHGSVQSENWALISNEVSSDDIDHIFPKSAQLDSGAIVHFVKCLVAISHMEIQQAPPAM